MLWFMGLQRVGHDWVTKLNWTEATEVLWKSFRSYCIFSVFVFQVMFYTPQQNSRIRKINIYSCLLPIFQFSLVTQSCLTLCDPMDCSTPGFSVHHQLPQLAQTDVHRVGDVIQLSHPLLSPSPPALNLSQHQGLFSESVLHIRWSKDCGFSFSHQSFQWIFRMGFL